MIIILSYFKQIKNKKVPCDYILFFVIWVYELLMNSSQVFYVIIVTVYVGMRAAFIARWLTSFDV
jgi:hypothetical protein